MKHCCEFVFWAILHLFNAQEAKFKNYYFLVHLPEGQTRSRSTDCRTQNEIPYSPNPIHIGCVMAIKQLKYLINTKKHLRSLSVSRFLCGFVISSLIFCYHLVIKPSILYNLKNPSQEREYLTLPCKMRSGQLIRKFQR